MVKRLVPGSTKPFDHQITRHESFVNKYFNRSLFKGVLNEEYDFARLGLQPTGNCFIILSYLSHHGLQENSLLQTLEMMKKVQFSTSQRCTFPPISDFPLPTTAASTLFPRWNLKPYT